MRIGPDQRRESFGHADDTDHIDFELSAKFRDRQFEQRTGNGNARIVDQPGEPFTGERIAHLIRGGFDCGFIGHVKDQRYKVRTEFRCKTFRIGRLCAHCQRRESRGR